MDVDTPRGEKKEPQAFTTGRWTQAVQDGEWPAYIAVDSEGFGADPLKYPSFAYALVVLSNTGRPVCSSVHYLPLKPGDEASWEPRCWKEYVREKLDPKVLKGYIDACAKSPYETVEAGWKAIAKEIDWIYETYDQPERPLRWITDCGHYDIGRLNQYLSQYAGRQEAWYSAKCIHWISDIGEAKKAVKAMLPDAWRAFQTRMKAVKFTKSHDPLEDAMHIGAEYVAFREVVEMNTWRYAD